MRREGGSRYREPVIVMVPMQLEKPFRDKAAEKTQELAMNAQCEKAEGVCICVCWSFFPFGFYNIGHLHESFFDGT